MSETPTAVDAFLDGLRSGDWSVMGSHYHDDVTFKGTVPRWYFTVTGREAVMAKMEDWFPLAAEVSDVHIMTTDEGAVVEFERHWVRPPELTDTEPEEVGVRQAHIFRVDADGRIYEQRGHCAGIWDAATFAEVEQAQVLPR